jgi:hypothetical protein
MSRAEPPLTDTQNLMLVEAALSEKTIGVLGEEYESVDLARRTLKSGLSYCSEFPQSGKTACTHIPGFPTN